MLKALYVLRLGLFLLAAELGLLLRHYFQGFKTFTPGNLKSAAFLVTIVIA
jgi:hypothetical protein